MSNGTNGRRRVQSYSNVLSGARCRESRLGQGHDCSWSMLDGNRCLHLQHHNSSTICGVEPTHCDCLWPCSDMCWQPVCLGSYTVECQPSCISSQAPCS